MMFVVRFLLGFNWRISFAEYRRPDSNDCTAFPNSYLEICRHAYRESV